AVLGARQVLLRNTRRLPQLPHGRLQPALRLLALGDVADAYPYPLVATAPVVDRPPVRRRPEPRAVLAPALKLVVLPAVPAQRAAHLAHRARGVVLADERRREVLHLQALRRRVAEHVEHARVDPDQLAPGVDPALAVVTVVRDRREFRLAVGKRLDAAVERLCHRVEAAR